MPRGDRTGPMGQGPMTGRELGFCAGYDTPGYVKGGGGRGFGFGGRGYRRRWGWRGGWDQASYFGSSLHGYGRGVPLHEAFSRDEEIRMLKAEADTLKQAQKNIEKRLSDLEKEKEATT
ncbi:MAG: DUF5320 domain-containing protein [Bacteroidales bacterium]|nr:DUF5320 domain-containing protein [Lentimicrobiaceae bacterium]MDD5695636.1 DUF5320 domain-containing protein [Bacteroidales bacterium]